MNPLANAPASFGYLEIGAILAVFALPIWVAVIYAIWGKPGHFTLRSHREFQLHMGKVREYEAQQIGMFEEQIDLFGMGESR